MSTFDGRPDQVKPRNRQILALPHDSGGWRPQSGCFKISATEIRSGRCDMDTKKYAAEAIGTFWLTFAVCGSAVIAAGFPQVGIGLLGVSFAFGLSVVTMAYAIGHVSGCHLN